MSDDSESGLVALAVSGDEAALRSLITTHYQLIWRVCRRIVGNDADADDATQECLIKVIRNIGSFDQRSKFSTWVYRIASNSSLDLLRKRKRHLRAVSIDRVGDTARSLDIEDPTANETIEQVSERAAFDDALQTLDEDFRVPLVLRDVATLSYQEIADQLGVPVGTVKSRIARGRQALLAVLNDSARVDPTADSAEPDARIDDGNQGATSDVQSIDPPDLL